MDASKYVSYCEEVRRLNAVAIEAEWSKQCLFLGEGLYNGMRQDGDPEWAEAFKQCRADSLQALTNTEGIPDLPNTPNQLRCHCLTLTELLGVVTEWQMRQAETEPLLRDIPKLCLSLHSYRPNRLIRTLWALIREPPNTAWPAMPTAIQSAADAMSAIDEVIRWCDATETPQSSKWMTVAEAARITGIDNATISRAATNGKIKSNGKSRRQRRLDSASLNQWLLKRDERNESTKAISRALDQQGRGSTGW
jgi:excisionase family DNA binding protein